MRTHAKFASLLPLVAALLIAPGNGNARPTDDLLHDLNVTGTTTDVLSQAQSEFAGTLEVTGLLVDDDGNLIVQGLLTGLVQADDDTTDTDEGTTETDDVTTSVLGQIFSTSATLVDRGEARCDILYLDLAPLNLDLLGLEVDLDEVEIDIAGQRGPGRLLGNLLCSLTALLDNPDLLDKTRRVVSRANTILGGLLTNVPVTSEVEGTTVTGFLTVTSVAVDEDGDLILNGVLNGVITDDEMTTRIINQAFAAIAELSGGNGQCEVLSLDLGPLDLDLLGLEIDLAPVDLDIRGLQGTGNLLGNLLCNIARIADRGGSMEKAAPFIRKINNLLD